MIVAQGPEGQRMRPIMAIEILRYFLRNPQAVDSLEGVARWRVMDERIYRGVTDADEALRWLVSEGFLVRKSAHHSGDVFALNLGKRTEAAAFLEKTDRGPAKPRARSTRSGHKLT